MCWPGERGKAGAQGQLTAVRTPMFKNTQGISVRVKRGYELGQWDSYDTNINTKQSSLVPFKMALKEARTLAPSFPPSVPGQNRIEIGRTTKMADNS